MSKKIKNTLKRGLTLSLAGGTAVTGVAAAMGTSVVTTYAETLSNLKQVSVSNGWYTFASVQDESYVLDINGSGKNSNLRLYKKNDSENQKFYIESVGNNEYKIKTGASNGSYVLNAVNGNNTAGDNVNQYSYDGSIKDEKWKIYQDASGNYVFVSSTGDKVLDICGKNMANDTNIWLWGYYGANTQKWKLNAVKSANDTPTISSLNPATIDNGWYKITSSANSNLAIEVQGGTNANGVNIYGNTKNGSNNQEFYFEQISGNEYAIKTAVSDKARALDVVGGNSANGINVRQWDYSDRKAVHWKLYTDDEGNYVLVSSTGDKVLDLTGAKSTAGTNVWTWDYYGASTQEWKLTKIDKNPLSSLTQVSVSDGWYTFASVQDESYVLDVNGSGKNSNLRLYKKNDSENQKFYIESVGNNEYKIKTGASNGSLVLNAVNGNNTAGDNVNQYSYDGSIKDEKWKIYQDASGNYVFVSSTGDKVLDICGKKMANNTNIWLWGYYGANTQKWKLNKVEKSPISYLKQVTVSNGWYTFASVQDESYVLDVNGYSKNSNLRLYKKNDSENQKFYIESVGNNEYKIKTGASNGNLVLNAVNGNNTAGDNVNQYSYDDSIKDEKWKIYQDTSGNYVFVSSTGDKVLDICGKKMANDTNIWLWEYYGANTQKWKLNPINVKEGQEIADGTYTIGLASNNNYVFDVSYCSSKNGTKIQLMNRNGNIAQLFRIKYEGNGEYTINTGASLYNSSVDILGGNTTNATINQWANNSLAPQRWKITKSGNGYVFRSVINENLVLDASGASNGASLTLATYNANDNTQKFTLTKGSGWLISGDRKYYFNENGNKPEVGIDVSYHNGTIDWQKVKDDNISYAIIRSGYRTEKTEGKRNIGKDVKFEENVANASKVGMEYGVYFYSTAVTIEEANEEADAIIAALKGKNPSRGVYIDIESTVVYNAKFGSIYNSTARRTITDVTKKVCQRLKDAGYSVGVYASESYFNNVLYTDELQGYMWVARYYSNTSNDQNTLDLNGKYPYKYWQYSSVGRVNGISTAVDMNTTVR